MKNKNIYGVQFQTSELTGKRQLFLNHGGNRYSYQTVKEFFENAKDLKFAVQAVGAKTTFVKIDQYQPSGRFGDLVELIDQAKGYLNTKDEVVNLKSGSYLLELDDFVPLKSGSISYVSIQQYKGHTIKFEKNGVCGFSIWKDKTPLEDRLWSIKKCKEAIDEMTGGAK